LKKAFPIILVFLSICCLAVLMADVPIFEPGSKGVEDIPLPAQTGVSVPISGMCAEIGERHSDNPFLGWPTTFHPGDFRVITSWWIDPNYFRGYTHWGIDLGSWCDNTGLRYTTNLEAVISTAKYAVVTVAIADGGHHYGMGNNVQIRHVTCEETCGDMSTNLDDGWWQFLLQEDYWRCQPETSTEAPSPVPTEDSIESMLIAAKNQDQTDLVMLCEESGWRASYFHLNDVNVGAGELVEYGGVLGHIDNTGNSTGPHLHYQINCPDGGGTIDPAPAMCKSYSNDQRGVPQWSQESCGDIYSEKDLDW
jgi:murein DD-endopeptidase MepM/ murein hydrolase activator NlpD